jgi:two-component system NarL family response regulator
MLADDHPLFIEGLSYLLESYNIEVIGTAFNGADAIEKARLYKPDVLLMDIEMPICSGLDAIRPIKKEMPDVKIVMLTSFDDDDNLLEAIKRGASGYLLKNLNAENLIFLLNSLEQGEVPLSPGMAVRVLNEFARQAENQPDISNERKEPVPDQQETHPLTQRQTDVLNLVAQGMSYKEIGTALNLSERTIKYHMERILEILQLENRAQVIAYAVQNRKIPPG